MRLEVSPSSTGDDIRDRVAANTKERSEFDRAFALGGPVPYLANLISGESGCSHSLPYCLSSFRIPVGHVVALGSEEQMGGVHAQSLVATMQDVFSLRDWTVGILVGDSMSAEELSISANHAVAASIRRLRPQGAIVHDEMVTQ